MYEVIGCTSVLFFSEWSAGMIIHLLTTSVRFRARASAAMHKKLFLQCFMPIHCSPGLK